MEKGDGKRYEQNYLNIFCQCVVEKIPEDKEYISTHKLLFAEYNLNVTQCSCDVPC